MTKFIISDTGEYTNISEKELIKNISKYSVIQICAKISEYYHILRGKPRDRARNYAALAHLANLATIHCPIDKNLPENLIDDNTLKKLCQMVNAMDSNLARKIDIYKYLLIKANSQFVYQFNHSYNQAISFFLLNNIRISKFIENFVEMPVPTYFRLCVTLAYSFNDNGYTHFDKLISNYVPNVQANIKTLIKKFSLSAELLRNFKKTKKRYNAIEIDLYSFSILRDFPIYCIKDQYFLPIPGLLLNKISDAIYYDIIQSY